MGEMAEGHTVEQQCNPRRPSLASLRAPVGIAELAYETTLMLLRMRRIELIRNPMRRRGFYLHRCRRQLMRRPRCSMATEFSSNAQANKNGLPPAKACPSPPQDARNAL